MQKRVEEMPKIDEMLEVKTLKWERGGGWAG